MNKEEFNKFIYKFTDEQLKYYHNELLYYYENVEHMNFMEIIILSFDKYGIKIEMNQGSKRLTHKWWITWIEWNEIKRKNHVERLKHEN